MSSALTRVPSPKRRQLAATLGLFAVLFTTVGAVSITGSPASVRLFSAVSWCVAAFLALAAWGVLHSLRVEKAERGVDEAIEESLGSAGSSGLSCGCGIDHDVDELQVTCAQDGAGTNCTHSCEVCVLATLRPSPTEPRAARLGAAGSRAGGLAE